MSNLFDTIVGNLARVTGMNESDFREQYVHKMPDQTQVTSRPFNPRESIEVRLLHDVEETDSVRAFEAGEIVYARLYVDGIINLWPFEDAGGGYEMIDGGAEEGVDYEFLDDPR